MFAFGVPVPGTINAVAARLTADMSAVTTASTAVLSKLRTTRTTTRTAFRMCQQSHNPRQADKAEQQTRH